MQGILYLIESRNPPVFDTPMAISYKHNPEVHEMFFFGRSNRFDSCQLSTVQRITHTDGYTLIETLNSKYILYPLPEIL